MKHYFRKLTPRQSYYLKNANIWLMGFSVSFALGFMLFQGNLLYSSLIAVVVPTIPLLAATLTRRTQ